tara:strand:- start:330 stop:641 length:312 start_codon:yes stop_codon:yes gene_type:complete
MKKLFLILISVILFGCSENRLLLDELTNKGTDENRIIYYKSKLFNGVGFDIYPNSQLKEEGNHKDGKQDGLWKYYHKNGQLKEERNYINGIRDGLSKKWSIKI